VTAPESDTLPAVTLRLVRGGGGTKTKAKRALRVPRAATEADLWVAVDAECVKRANARAREFGWNGAEEFFTEAQRRHLVRSVLAARRGVTEQTEAEEIGALVDAAVQILGRGRELTEARAADPPPDSALALLREVVQALGGSSRFAAHEEWVRRLRKANPGKPAVSMRANAERAGSFGQKWIDVVEQLARPGKWWWEKLPTATDVAILGLLAGDVELRPPATNARGLKTPAKVIEEAAASVRSAVVAYDKRRRAAGVPVVPLLAKHP
jgi:hypothetical protein